MRKTSRILAASLATATIGAALAASAWLASRDAGKRIGISPDPRGSGLVVAQVASGLPAARAGLEPGDRILEIEGLPIGGLADYDHAASHFEAGEPYEVGVERGGARFELTVVPGAPFPWAAFLLGALTALGHLALAVLVLAQPARSLRARLLLLLCLAVALEFAWPFSSFHAAWVSVSAAAYYLLSGLQMGLELHLVSLIPHRPAWLVPRPWLVPAYYGVGALLALAAAGSELAAGLGGVTLSWPLESAGLLMDFVAVPLWALAVLVLLRVAAWRAPEPRGRHQALLVMLGVLPWALLTWVSTAYGSLGAAVPGWLSTVQPLAILCYPVALLVAISRYQLFRIHVVVRRGLLYTFLSAALLLVFYGLLGLGSLLLPRAVPGIDRSVWLISGVTLLIGLLFSPLRELLQRFLERRFFPERIALRQRVTALAAELPGFGAVPRMAEHLVASLAEIFALRAVTLLLAHPKTGVLITSASTLIDLESTFEEGYLLSPDDPGVLRLKRAARPLGAAVLMEESASLGLRLTAFEAETAVPLSNGDRLVGVLLIGDPAHGSEHVEEEGELLQLLAHHAASILENARLIESVTVESLTGLLRREAVLEKLGQELARALRYRRPLTVAMVDLDHFKAVNDRHGHLAGDTMLKLVARSLLGAVRGSDLVGRYGGEEFLMVMPETDLAGAGALAEKLREKVEGLKMITESGTVARVTLSVGLASLEDSRLPAQPTVRDLLAAADASLYLAKRAGRNRVEPLAAAG